MSSKRTSKTKYDLKEGGDNADAPKKYKKKVKTGLTKAEDKEKKKALKGIPHHHPEYGEDADTIGRSTLVDSNVARNDQQTYPGAVSVPGIGGGEVGDIEDNLEEARISNSATGNDNERNAGDGSLISAYVVEEEKDDPSAPPEPSVTTSTEPVYVAQQMNRRRHIWKYVVVGLLIVLVGVGVAVAVILAKPSSSSADSSNNDSDNPKGTDPGDSTSPDGDGPSFSDTPSPTIVKTPNPTVIGRAEDFDTSIALRDYNFHGDSVEKTTKGIVSNAEECKQLCANFDVALHINNGCECYAGVDCLLRYDNGLNTGMVAYGTIFSKGLTSVCPYDYCEAYPNSWLCLTQYEANLRSYTLGEAGGFYNALNVAGADSETDCLEACGEYDAARYASTASGGPCVCYSRNETASDEFCAIPWGDQVDRYTIASGSIFSKDDLSTCSFDWCDANPNHWFCLTKNTAELRSYAFDESGGFKQVASFNAESRNDCLEFCQEYDACRYASNVNGETCLCYDEIDGTEDACVIPWGDQVDRYTIASGDLYFKRSTTACSFDWCDANPNHWFCLTKNTVELRSYAFDESGGFKQVASFNAGSRNDCLEFCQEYDACRYASNVVGDTCICYDEINDTEDACVIPWGDQVDRYAIASGKLYFKKPTGACSFNWCTEYPDHKYCT